ncbi:ABC transporter C family member 5-like protein, partial [Tanacetum coccineum]
MNYILLLEFSEKLIDKFGMNVRSVKPGGVRVQDALKECNGPPYEIDYSAELSIPDQYIKPQPERPFLIVNDMNIPIIDEALIEDESKEAVDGIFSPLRVHLSTHIRSRSARLFHVVFGVVGYYAFFGTEVHRMSDALRLKEFSFGGPKSEIRVYAVVRSYQAKATRVLAGYRHQNGVCSHGGSNDLLPGPPRKPEPNKLNLFHWLLMRKTKEKLFVVFFQCFILSFTEIGMEIESSRPALSNIQMKVERGMRVPVCGSVGSWKSSFLCCILGEIPKVSCEVTASQPDLGCGCNQCLAFDGTLVSWRRNLTWTAVLAECYLQRHTGSCQPSKAYTNGEEEELQEDATIVLPVETSNTAIEVKDGEFQLDRCSSRPALSNIQMKVEQGMSVPVCGSFGWSVGSGMVQLARALYQDADIYLLDDPFSAVDAHTGSELFKEYIMTTLVAKTVVFVTHQIEFLPTADLIL